MAAIPAQETSTAAPTFETTDSLPSMPCKSIPSIGTVDTPPDTPTAEPSSPSSVVVPDTSDDKHEGLAAKQLETSEVRGDVHLDEEQCVEHGNPLASGVTDDSLKTGDVKFTNNNSTTQTNIPSFPDLRLPGTTIESKRNDASGQSAHGSTSKPHDEPAANIKTCELHPEKSAPTPTLSRAVHEAPSVFNEHSSDDKPADSGPGQDASESFRTDEDIVVDSSKQANAAPEQPQSVPPHMRPMTRAVSSQSVVESRRDWPVQLPRAPRAYQPGPMYQASRPPLHYDDFRRTEAQLMKTRNDLEDERKLNAELRKTVGAEMQNSVSTAMSDMLTDLLRRQADALTAKAKAQEKERGLQYREQKITQLEIYLSEGQKQLKYQLEQQGIRPMSVVDEANLRREIELTVKHQLSGIEDKIASQVERLRYQEAAQKIREQQYMVLVRDDLEKEVREQLSRDMQAEAAEVKMPTTALASNDLARNDDFLKGYATCHVAHTALHKLREGLLAANSPELAFLYDPTHVENPHNVGLSIGRMGAETSGPSSANAVSSRTCMAEGAARAATLAAESQTSTSAHAFRGSSHAQLTAAEQPRLPPAAYRAEQVRPPLLARPPPAQHEDPVWRSAPPRPTFAGELRGASIATPNGVFASRAPSSALSANKTAGVTSSSGAPRSGVAGRVGESVYAGRRAVRYEEDSGDDPAAPNLIDLY